MSLLVRKFLKIFYIVILILSSTIQAKAKLVEYQFDIDNISKNITGKPVTALAVGGQIPAPTIEATVGDTLRVTFNNKLSVDSSIHWHGVLLPNDQDGVPYLTTQPIKAKSSFTYEYPITHSGTYWYHSHTGLQEQQAVYGSIIFHPKNGERIKADKEQVIVFSDWTNEKPKDVLLHLKQDGDYYALKKDTVQSWHGVLQNGWPAVKNRIQSAWTRMGPMDISDVGYDAFLANGKTNNYINAKPGETVRLRLINAAASSYFYVQFAAGPMTVVAADGIDIKPIKVKKLRMTMAETYDVIVKVPGNHAYELRNSSEDGTGFASTYIGQGKKILAPTIKRPNLYKSDHSMHNMSGMDHSQMKHHNMHHGMQHHAKHSEVISEMTEYNDISALEPTTLPSNRKLRTVKLNLTGNMERYVWSFNNKTLSQADNIIIKKGENVRFELNNETMMHHPVHLHGHFFRVLNKHGEYSPLKHTVNVPPMGSVTIEFQADEEKDWLFHCHNLYHMMSGMTRIVSYEKATKPSILKKLWHDQDWFHAIDLGFYSNLSVSQFKLSNAQNIIEAEYEYNYKKEYDIDLIFERNITRFLSAYAGGNSERKHADEKPETIGIVGIHYVLPLLIESNFRLDTNGKVRLGFDSTLPLTSRIYFLWNWNTHNEYQFQLKYELTKQFIIAGIFDSDEQFGVGFHVKF